MSLMHIPHRSLAIYIEGRALTRRRAQAIESQREEQRQAMRKNKITDLEDGESASQGHSTSLVHSGDDMKRSFGTGSQVIATPLETIDVPSRLDKHDPPRELDEFELDSRK